MSGNVIELGIRLNYDGKSIDGGVSISREHLRQFSQDAKRAGDAASASFSSASQGVRSISAQLDQAKSAVAGYFTLVGGYNAARWITEQASALAQLDARLKVATGSLADYQRAQSGVFDIANRWGASVEQTAGAFARLNPVLAQMGAGAGTTLRMLDGLGASLRLTGATAAETSSVLMQFSQAMGSGRVGGDEFRSMMENAEPMMRAVAGQMGKTTAELRQMAEVGALTSSVFGNALLPAIDKLVQQAAQIPLGLGQALQVMKNNLLRDFGAEFADGGAAVAQAIQMISGHTGEAAAAVHALVYATGELAKAGAVLAAGGGAAYLTTKARAAYEAVAGLAAARAAAVAAAEADVLAARNSAVATAATLAKAQAERAAYAEMAIYNAGRARVEAELAAAQAAHVVSANAAAAAETRLTATMEAQTVAAGAKALALRGASAASGLASAAMGVLGGPIGLVTGLLVTGAAAWAAWGDSAASATDKTAQRVDWVKGKLAELAAQQKYGAGDLGSARKALEDAEKILDAKVRAGRSVSTDDLATARQAVAEAQKLVDAMEASAATSGAGAATAKLTAAGEYAKLTEKLKWREKLVAEHQQALIALDTAYNDKLAQTAVKDKEALTRNYQAARQALQDEQRRELDGMNGAKDGRAEIVARADAEVAAYRALAKRLGETLKHEYEQMRISTADYVASATALEQQAMLKEIMAIKQKLAAANKASEKIPLQEKLAELQAALDALPAKAQAALEDADSKARAGLDKLRVAAGKTLEPLEKAAVKFEQQFGETMREAVRDGNQAGIELGQQVWAGMIDEEKFDAAKREYDALFAELKAGLDQIRQGSGNDGGLVAALDAAGASDELKSKLLPALQALIEKMREAAGNNPINAKTVTEATGNITKITHEIDPVWKDMIKRVDGTFHDGFVKMLEGGKGSWKGFTESLKNTFKSTVADAIYQMFARPFVFQAIASVGQAAGIPGLAGDAGQGGGGGGVGDMLSMGSNVASLFGGGGTVGAITGSFSTGLAAAAGGADLTAAIAAYEAAGMTGVATSLGAGAAAGSAAASAGLGAAAQGLAAALPVIGWVIAGAAIISSLMGEGGGPKTEGDATFGIGDDGKAAYRHSDGYYTANVADGQMKTLTGSLAQSVGDTIKSLGGSGAGLGLTLGFNTDPQGDAPDNISGAVRDASGKVAYEHVYDAERGSYAKEIEVEAKRVMLAAISASDVNAAYKSIVSNIDLMTASAEQLDQALVDINNLHAVLGAGDRDPFADYAASMEAAGGSYMLQLERQGTALLAAARAYDGSSASIATLAGLTQQRYNIELQLAKQLDDLVKSSATMYAGGRRDIEMAGLDAAGKYDYYDKEAARYRDTLATLTDPAMIQEYRDKLFQSTMAGFGTLDEGQQVAKKGEFLARLDDQEKLANERIAASKEAVKAENDQYKTAVVEAIDKAMTAAADKIAAAASKPQVIEVKQTIDLRGATGAEVGGWGSSLGMQAG